ncbi:MAG: homocysteine biosynthesis protein [Desulforegulaceae bacterium]|nr:homocysteine biosynthesis protein [Desulforegulaceae bacterium]
MTDFKVKKTYKEINDKIKSGQAVVVTAEEMIGIVEEEGEIEAAKRVDVVTTGTFAPMCSSGLMINTGQADLPIKVSKASFNKVAAYAGVAAVDCYLGATEPSEEDPLNKVWPGSFSYGGGHVIEDLVNGKTVKMCCSGYGTDCYPNKSFIKEVTLADLPYALLCNPRNAYQNYNCAVNVSNKTIYTYMGTLRPKLGNANYCSAGQLSPLLNDPYLRTIGIGTRIFLGGGVGYVSWQGTQSKIETSRKENGVPDVPSATLFVIGDLKQMSGSFLRGVSIRGYGCSLSVGLGIPIPVLNEEMARFTSVKDEDIYTQVVDYSYDYPNATGKIIKKVNYGELKSGEIEINGRKVPSVPLSSMVKAREIADILKKQISDGKFLLGEPQFSAGDKLY